MNTGISRSMFQPMYWSSNDFSGFTSASFLRNKTAQTRLLERLRFEKPVLNVVSCPTVPIPSGRKRLKFPDPNNDCYVELELTGQTARVSLPLHYASEEREELEVDDSESGGSLQGLWYSLQLASVTRFSLDGDELVSDQPDEAFYCYCPLSEQRKTNLQSPKSVFGFWFRFFGEETRFHIKVSIKLEGVELLPKEYCKNDPYFSDICKGGNVCTLEFEICTASREHETCGTDGKPKSKINKTGTKPSDSCLYANEKYRKFIQAVQEMKSEARYGEVERLLCHAFGRYHADNDLKVVVLLEQGLEACRKRYCDYAKELFRNAANLLNRCKNKALLTGRTYVYLSEVHFNEGCIGNAGESLDIARKNLEGLGCCEDLGDLCFHEGLVLMVHAKRNQVFLKKLIPEAREKFLDAIHIYQEGTSVGDMSDKLYCSYIKLASLELQPLPYDGTEGLVVLPAQVTTAQHYLDKVKEHLQCLSRRTKLYYYLCSAELFLEKNSVDEAKENFSLAQDIAECDNLKNNVHVDIALEEIRRCLEEELVAKRTAQALDVNQEEETVAAGGSTDVLDGYLGDEST